MKEYLSNARPFLKAAVTAFPVCYHVEAKAAASALAPIVDNNYRMSAALRLIVAGEIVRIPKRINFIGLKEGGSQIKGDFWPAIQCLCTRSTDGYMRQAAIAHVFGIDQPWAIPFVVLLAGEYVIEISQDLVASLPALNRPMYANFVRENRSTMCQLRSQATSYWNCYYRATCPDRTTYPGLAFLHQLELWAS